MAKRTVTYRYLLISIGRDHPQPTTIFEDTIVTIAQVLKDRLTPREKQMDILIT